MSATVTYVEASNWEQYKGQRVNLIGLEDDAVVPGTLVSLNTKGWTIKTEEGKTLTRSVKKTVAVELDVPAPSARINHTDCTHPRTPAGRQACRSERRASMTLAHTMVNPS